MALFGDRIGLLANHHIYSTVCDLIADTESELIVVSPYLDLTENFLRELKRRRYGGYGRVGAPLGQA